MQLDWPNHQIRHRQQLAGRSAHQLAVTMDDNCNEMDDGDGECDCELCQLGDGGGVVRGGGGGGFVNVGELSGSRFDLK